MSEPSSDSVTRPSLLLRLRDGADSDSWRTFVETYAPLIYSYCRRQGLQEADAADISQDVLLQAARSLRTFEYRPERGRFRDWLGTVTRHRIARFLRCQQHQVRAVGGPESDELLERAVTPEPDAEWTAEFNAQVLRVALERVRPQVEPTTWRAFQCVWLEHRPVVETARETGLPVDGVYAAKSRVLKRLRDEVLMLSEDLVQFVPLGHS
jgi:RNA polymerase sigma factor (sigma-70 family)